MEDFEVETRELMEARVLASIGWSHLSLGPAGDTGSTEGTFLAGFLAATAMSMEHPEWIQALSQFGAIEQWAEAWEDSKRLVRALIASTPIKQLGPDDIDEVRRSMAEFMIEEVKNMSL